MPFRSLFQHDCLHNAGSHAVGDLVAGRSGRRPSEAVLVREGEEFEAVGDTELVVTRAVVDTKNGYRGAGARISTS